MAGHENYYFSLNRNTLLTNERTKKRATKRTYSNPQQQHSPKKQRVNHMPILLYPPDLTPQLHLPFYAHLLHPPFN